MPHKPYSRHRSLPPAVLPQALLPVFSFQAGQPWTAPSFPGNLSQGHRTHTYLLTDLISSLPHPCPQPHCHNPDSDTEAGILNPAQLPVPKTDPGLRSMFPHDHTDNFRLKSQLPEWYRSPPHPCRWQNLLLRFRKGSAGIPPVLQSKLFQKSVLPRIDPLYSRNALRPNYLPSPVHRTSPE